MSPAATTAKGAPKGAAPAAAAASFMEGTYPYSEVIFSDIVTPGTTVADQIHQIQPGGFLRGISLYVSSSGGALGSGSTTPDNPWSLFNYLTLESIDGTPLKYPLGGYAYYLESRYARPWDGDPAIDPVFAAGANPAFRFRYFLEARATLGVVPNTDARAQYRFRYNIAALAALISGGTPTAPTVTITGALEIYAQPPSNTLGGVPIQQIPDGIALQRFTSHQIDNTVAADQTIKENRTGNLIRTLLLIFRDATNTPQPGGNRTDLTTDPIRWRIDNTQLLVEQRQRRDYEQYRRFSQYGGMTRGRPPGVYPYPRWHEPGEMDGDWWLETTEATFHQFEEIGAVAGGTLETVVEDIAPVGPIPAYLNGI